jgi:hypothetical protein
MKKKPVEKPIEHPPQKVSWMFKTGLAYWRINPIPYENDFKEAIIQIKKLLK